MTEEQFEQLKNALLDEQRDLYLRSHVSKDKETSGLHRDILTKIERLDEKITSHDELISTLAKMLPEIKEAVVAYKNTGIITKAVIGFVLGVPALAGCIAGIIYMVGLLSNKQ